MLNHSRGATRLLPVLGPRRPPPGRPGRLGCPGPLGTVEVVPRGGLPGRGRARTVVSNVHRVRSRWPEWLASRVGSVVVLSKHPLLGEGIAHDLRARTGIEAIVASAFDVRAVCEALTTNPKVVVFERTSVIDDLPLGELAPEATFVDVTHAVAAGSQAPQCLAGLEMIAEMVLGRPAAHTPAVHT